MLKKHDGNEGVSFVIPSFNEEVGIEETIHKLQKTLQEISLPHEVIVVNDGSSDRTLELIRNIANIKIISHPVNVGYGASIKSGIRAASHVWIGIIDADGSYAPDDIPALIQEMRRGVCMAVGARQNIREHDSLLKGFLRNIFKKIINFTLRYNILDPNSGLRIFKKDVALKFFPFLCDTFSFTTTLTVLAIGEAHFVTYVPIAYFPRKGKSKVKHFRDSLRTFQLIMAGITFLNPMKFFMILILCFGLFVCIPAVLLGLMGHLFAAQYYTGIGAVAFVLLGLGGLGDIIRATRLIRETEKNEIF